MKKILTFSITLLFVGLIISSSTGYNVEQPSNRIPNNPPYEPSNPIPPNGSINVIPGCLEWTGGDPDGDTVTYDVYCGNTIPPYILFVYVHSFLKDIICFCLEISE